MWMSQELEREICQFLAGIVVGMVALYLPSIFLEWAYLKRFGMTIRARIWLSCAISVGIYTILVLRANTPPAKGDTLMFSSFFLAAFLLPIVRIMRCKELDAEREGIK